MKSMVCNYSSVEREIEAYVALNKVGKTSGSTGKQYVRQALDQFELHHGDRNYHFLIHEPLGVSLQFFLQISGGSLPIDYVKDLTSRILHALQFIHNVKVIHAGSASSDTMIFPLIQL
jgi:serine/threonine-protein kinase SRPK3